MKVAIMQPYFLPYIGYWQLLASVDQFILYDNIKYTKKGWINRNRILQNGSDTEFTISLKKDSDFLDVRERFISPDFNRAKFLNKIVETYRKAPCFSVAFPVVEKIVNCDETNLFAYIFNSINEICSYLSIQTNIIVSSNIAIDHTLKGQDKVLELCKACSAEEYVNAIGGQMLYSKNVFAEAGIGLKFLKTGNLEYPQFQHDFIPWLSIVDLMMFNEKTTLSKMLQLFEYV